MDHKSQHEDIHSVVASICDRHYPLCEASGMHYVEKNGVFTSNCEIHFNHGLVNIDCPIFAPIIKIVILSFEGEEKVTVKIFTQFRVGPEDWPIISMNNIQTHQMINISHLTLMNFGMMLDPWLNVVGYMINDAREYLKTV